MSGRPVVLIVDDDPEVLEVMCAQFAAAGCETRQAMCGNAAVRAIFSGKLKVDLVLTDLHMQDGSGISVRDACVRANLPCMIVSAFPHDYQREIKDTPMLSKPAQWTEIERIARELIREQE